MKKTKVWSGAEKAAVVCESLRGRPLEDIYEAYQISPDLYAQWQKQFISFMGQAFEEGPYSCHDMLHPPRSVFPDAAAIDLTDPNIVYFVGNTALPTNTAVFHLYGVGALGLLVNISTSLILDVNITLTHPLSREFIKRQMVGRYLNTDIERIITDLERYQGQARSAIVVAVRSIADRYNKYMERLAKNQDGAGNSEGKHSRVTPKKVKQLK